MKTRPSVLFFCVALALSSCWSGCSKKKADAEPPEEVAGCSPPAGAYVPPDPDELEIVVIPPELTAAEGEVIDAGDNHILVVPPAGRTVRPELFVWIPGSGGRTPNYRHVLSIAAYAGYRTLSVAYANDDSVRAECTRDSDEDETLIPCDRGHTPECEEGVRMEIIYGASVHDSQCMEVDRANSIENRLVRALQHLVRTREGEGYDTFLDATGEAIEWSEIVIAGWSQGGGHAGLIARDHEVARAIFVSKGVGTLHEEDYTDAELAPWAFDERATPASREFGAIHQNELAHNYSPEAFAEWGMGAFGPAKRIDELTSYPEDYAEYECSHIIETGKDPACGPAPNGSFDDADYHRSMATDDCIALGDDGVPILAPAYYYLFTVEVPEE